MCQLHFCLLLTAYITSDDDDGAYGNGAYGDHGYGDGTYGDAQSEGGFGGWGRW